MAGKGRNGGKGKGMARKGKGEGKAEIPLPTRSGTGGRNEATTPLLAVQRTLVELRLPKYPFFSSIPGAPFLDHHASPEILYYFSSPPAEYGVPTGANHRSEPVQQ